MSRDMWKKKLLGTRTKQKKELLLPIIHYTSFEIANWQMANPFSSPHLKYTNI
jgi:hypothetical protein